MCQRHQIKAMSKPKWVSNKFILCNYDSTACPGVEAFHRLPKRGEQTQKLPTHGYKDYSVTQQTAWASPGHYLIMLKVTGCQQAAAQQTGPTSY